MIDPARIYTSLLNTGLQQKDNPLYQVLHDLIGLVISQQQSINIFNSSGGVGPQGKQGLQGIPGNILEEFDTNDFSLITSVSSYWLPNSNGIYYNDGFVSIGIPANFRKLSVTSAQQVVASFSSTGGINSFLRLFNSADGEAGGLQLQAIPGGACNIQSVKDFGFITTGGAFPITFAPNSSELMRLVSGGNGRLNIGFTDTDNNTNPIKVYIIGDNSAPLLASERESDSVVIQGTAVINGDRRSVLGLYDTTGFGAGIGPGILFAAKTSASGTGVYDSMGFIQGVKENGTDGNSSGALELGTRVNGGSGVTQIHISSVGKTGFRNKIPLATIHSITNGDNNNTEHAYFFDPDLATDAFLSYLLIGKRTANGDSAVFGHIFKTTSTLGGAFIGVYGDSPPVGLFVQKGGNVGINTTAPTAQFSISEKFQVNTNGLVPLYNNIATVKNGIPSEYAAIDTTGLTANVGVSTLYAVLASGEGLYRVSAYVVETVAGSLSSTLPNVQIIYTDKDSNVSVTIDATPILGIAGIGQTGALNSNTIGTASSGVIAIYVKASTTIQYQTVNYASNLAGMTYALHIRLEAL